MTISYNIGFCPKWYISDLTGKPLGGGYMATFRSVNPTQQKLVYQDIGGAFPWPYVSIPNTSLTGILFDENGAQGPFYFEFDTMNANELYYIEIYDSDGVLQWTINNYTGSGQGGGGSNVTTSFNLQNLIINNQFLYNTGTSARPIPGSIFLAPSNSVRLSPTERDILFNKLAPGADDQIDFPNFALGSTPFSPFNTPEFYMRYRCFNDFSPSTEQAIRYPITYGVKNFENQNLTVGIWAIGTSGTTYLDVYVEQYFGTAIGGTSASVSTFFGRINLTPSWGFYTLTETLPSVAGKILSPCGDHGIYVHIDYPLGKTCEIGHILPSLYLGNTAPQESFTTGDYVNAQINAPRPGDFKMAIYNSALFVPNQLPGGWVICNDGTIGSASSLATTLASILTWPLYYFIYTNVSDTYAPVTGGRSGNAAQDFAANKPIALTKMLGRVIASIGIPSSGGSGTNWLPGQFFGEENTALTNPNQNAPHFHNPGSFEITIGGTASGDPPSTVNSVYAATSNSANHSYPVLGSSAFSGGGATHNTIQPTVHHYVYLKL